MSEKNSWAACMTYRYDKNPRLFHFYQIYPVFGVEGSREASSNTLLKFAVQYA